VSEDWERLAGEKGERVPTGRLKRALKLGSMGARVTASSLMSKVSNRLMPGSEEARERALQEAYQRHASRAVEVLGQLKGASMKIGQLLSADPEMIPDDFAEAFSSLQRDAPPMTYVTVRDQIEGALDRPLEAVFTFFDPEPIGAASLGQVHRARLQGGQEVAVKVQYPGVADALDSDLKTLGSLMKYARAVIDKERLAAYMAEIREILVQELDYTNEAKNLERFQEILARRPGVRSPEPILEWTRPTVLVMEFMEGEKLDEALEAMGDGPRRTEILTRWVSLFSWMFHEQFELHADPHPGNFLLTEDDELILLDFGCVRAYEPRFADGFLDVLDACWQDDRERAVEAFLALGFGPQKMSADEIDPDLLAEYNGIILAPFLRNEPFFFGDWAPARDGKMFMLKHPSFFRLAPPSGALSYMRVLSGIKGLLAKMDARIDVATMAVETARRRGRLTAEPVIFDRQ
jgi:predicted unusual protein kinase regulating ubiquinone biosynthesis (AarF/ABC1/UbiB family)